MGEHGRRFLPGINWNGGYLLAYILGLGEKGYDDDNDDIDLCERILKFVVVVVIINKLPLSL